MNEMQTQAIREIQSGSQLLIVAPTGSGKTEAALFPVLEALGADDREGIRALYVTPLRALNRNLIDRVLRLVASTKLTAAVRHGDTPPSERRKQAANPPDILITTPETLKAILHGKVMQRHLRSVRYVIIDDAHQFAGDRRGTPLRRARQRLRRHPKRHVQRIAAPPTLGKPHPIPLPT